MSSECRIMAETSHGFTKDLPIRCVIYKCEIEENVMHGNEVLNEGNWIHGWLESL